MSDFSSKASVAVNDTSFLDSNSIIAKFAFLILVVVAFVGFVQIGIVILGYFLTNPNPILVKGQITGTTALAPITQNPSLASSLQILWSNNQPTGLEYTWSVWLQYTPSQNSDNQYHPVFIKGDCSNPKNTAGSITTTVNFKVTDGTAATAGTDLLNTDITNNNFNTSLLINAQKSPPTYSLNNGPGLYFYNDFSSVHLLLIIDVLNQATPTIIDIPNIPIDKYFHLAIRCQNIYIDIYINGSIVKRTKLLNVPVQNFYNVYVCPAGGFNGYLSTLQYYSRALSVVDINAIASGKPDTNMLSSSKVNIATSNYLSTSWYNSFIH